jgi:tRNA-specific 2-thiouridylase
VVGRNQEDNQGLERVESNKYVVVKLPVAGPYSVMDRDASQEDRALASKLAVTYAKSSADERYEVLVGEESFFVSPFKTKQEAQAYFFNA